MGKTLLNASLISIYINEMIIICLENIKTQKKFGSCEHKKKFKTSEHECPFQLEIFIILYYVK